MRNRFVPKMNDLDLRLEVFPRLCQTLRYIWRWISRKPLKTLFQLDDGWWSFGAPIGNGIWAIKWSRDRWRHVTRKVLWGSTVGYPSDSLASCYIMGTKIKRMKIDQYCQRQRCNLQARHIGAILACFCVARVCQRQLGFLVTNNNLMIMKMWEFFVECLTENLLIFHDCLN